MKAKFQIIWNKIPEKFFEFEEGKISKACSEKHKVERNL